MDLIKTPGYVMQEYKLVIPLPEALEHKIHGIRQSFGQQYSHRPDSSRPHLALIHFFQVSMLEERIQQKIRGITMAESPFLLEFRDYGHFPSHTIFINLATREPLRQLVKLLRELKSLLPADKDHAAHFIGEPVVSIARKLKPWQYEKAWLEYAGRQFTGRCIVDALLLLRRREGTLPWQIAGRFELSNLPVRTKQQELF